MVMSVIMGEHSYGVIQIIGKKGHVTVGKFCSIASQVTAILVGHRHDFITTYPFQAFWPKSKKLSGHPTIKNITIGNDVWIGQDVKLMGGINIGDGAVIGAGSVVRRSVEPYSIVIGNPAEIVKKRFSDDQIKKLLSIRWWDWPESKIEDNLELLCSPSIDGFLKTHYKKGEGA